MRLRYGIPLMLALALLATLVSRPNGFNAFAWLVGLSAIAIALDSRRLNAREYRTPLGQHPIVVGLLAFFFWPIVLPWWLSTRRLIARGELERGQPPRWTLGCLAVPLVAVPVAVALWLLSDGRARDPGDLLPVIEEVREQSGARSGSFEVRGGNHVVVTLAMTSPPEDLDAAAQSAAALVFERVDSAAAVTIEFLHVRERGALRTSRGLGRRTWTRAQYAELARASSEPRDSLRVVLALRPRAAGDVGLEVVALIDSTGAFHAPPLTLDVDPAQRILDEHLAPGTRWFGGSGGEVVAPLEITSSAQIECFGLGARARFAGSAPARVTPGIALRDSIAAGPFLFTPTPSDEERVRAAARALLERHGATPDVIAQVEWGPTRVVHEEDLVTIVAHGVVPGEDTPAFLVALPQPSGPRADGGAGGSAGGGADGGVPAAALTPFTIHDARSFTERRRPELFDAADLDGDGRPELILLERFYESWRYTILHRDRGGAWRPVYEGGGSGC